MSPAPGFVLACWLALAGPGAGLGGPPVEAPKSYAELLEAAAARSDSAGIAALRKGLRLRVTDPVGAARAFRAAAGQLPGLADWALLLEAEAVARSGDTASVRRLLGEIEPGLAADRGWLATVTARRAAKDLSDAAAVAADAAGRVSGDARRAQATVLHGTLRLSLGDTVGAAAAFRSAIAAAPGSSHALDAARSLSALRTAGPEDHLLVGRLYLQHGNIDRGLSGFDVFLRTAKPTAAETARLRLELARAYAGARRYGEAEARLNRLIGDPASPAIAAEARLVLGRMRLRQRRVDAGLEILSAALEGDLSPEGRAEALFLLADVEQDRARPDRAATLYRRLLAEFPNAQQAGDAAMRLGSYEYSAGRIAAAARIFDGYHRSHAVGPRAQQAGFWAGQAWLQVGDSAAAAARFDEVRRLDPASFYGLRSGEILGVPLSRALTASPRPGALSRQLAAGAVERVEQLERVGLTDEAEIEAERAMRFFGLVNNGLYDLAEAFHQRGRTLDAVRLGREIRRRGDAWNDRLLRIIYPLPFRDEIVTAARQRGLDPYLVAGLIRQESLFERAARSRAGAVGLMQILPPTGRDLARRDGLKGFTASMLTDPAVNIRLGTLFIADLLQRHDGRLQYALAAYNAGPSRVSQWLRSPEPADPDLFAEQIPFAETRDYVRLVQQNARIYSALYGSDDGDSSPPR